MVSVESTHSSCSFRQGLFVGCFFSIGGRTLNEGDERFIGGVGLLLNLSTSPTLKWRRRADSVCTRLLQETGREPAESGMKLTVFA